MIVIIIILLQDFDRACKAFFSLFLYLTFACSLNKMKCVCCVLCVKREEKRVLCVQGAFRLDEQQNVIVGWRVSC